jgi:hypothetical protein
LLVVALVAAVSPAAPGGLCPDRSARNGHDLVDKTPVSGGHDHRAQEVRELGQRALSVASRHHPMNDVRALMSMAVGHF